MRKPDAPSSPSSRPAVSKGSRGNPKRDDARLWLYGRHAVAAALLNPNRKIRRVVATKNALDWLTGTVDAALLAAQTLEEMKPDAIDRLLPAGSVHQGLAAHTYELARCRLRDTCSAEKPGPVVVLDQITDTHNIGAIFRTAAAFGAQAVVFQDRRTPPLGGALAKAAAGAIEVVPAISVVNIARAVEALNEMGFVSVGLAGEATRTLAEIGRDKPIALVMGAEGAGLRQLVRKTCATLARIDIAPAMESLNVSNAAAISLYEVTRT